MTTMRFSFGDFLLDCDQGVLWKGDNLVSISPKALEALRLLVLGGGRVVTKHEFMTTLWPNSFVEDSNLTQNIFMLRKSLGLSNEGRPYIETVPKRGYRFAGTIQVQSPTPGPTQPCVDKIDEKTGVLLADAFVSPPPKHTWLAWLSVFAVILLAFVLYGFFHLPTPIRVAGYVRLTNDGALKEMPTTPATIIPVGSKIEFTETDGEQKVLAQVPLQGGEVSYAALPSLGAHLICLQPDSHTLLFASDWNNNGPHPLFSLDSTTGRTARPVNFNAQDASWSADGSKVAYAQGGKVFVRTAGGAAHLIASVGGQAYWIRWSPDGRLLRFTENYDGYHDRIWEVNRGGANPHIWLPNETDSDHACCGSWTKSGKAFIYLSVQPNNNRIRIRPEHETPWDWWRRPAIEVPAAPLDRWAGPVPSADSKHIFAIGEQLRGRLLSIDLATQQSKPMLPGLSAEGVNFSPNGAQIAWTAYPEGTLWRSRSDGSGRIQLTKAPLLARFPHWSPDGKRIVFTGASPGSNWQVYSVPSLGGEATQLVHDANGQGVPTWSPDGKQIAFGHTKNGDASGSFFIEILRLGDREATRVPGSEGLWTPRWSPNGLYLSAVTADNRHLKLYDIAARQWIDLASVSMNDVVWSPDSESLFFDSDSSAEPVLYRFRLKDKRLEICANLNNIRRAGFFAPWLGISPDGSPIVLEDASSQELYSIAVDLP